MTAKIDAFIAEIRSRPEFIAGAAADPQKHRDLAAIEDGVDALDRHGADDPAAIEIVDQISALVARADLSIKQKLLELCALLIQARNAGRIVH